METLDSNVLERTVRKIARSPDASRKLALKRLAQARAKNPRASDWELKTKAAKTIVRGHALRTGVSGGVTGALGTVPGVSTVAAIGIGVSADIVAQMKADVDMCHALVYVYKPHLREDEAFSLAVTLATYGTLEKKGLRLLGKRRQSLRPKPV